MRSRRASAGVILLALLHKAAGVFMLAVGLISVAIVSKALQVIGRHPRRGVPTPRPP